MKLFVSFLALSLTICASSAYAQSGRAGLLGGLSALGDFAGDVGRMQIDADNQIKAIELQHRLEMERMERQAQIAQEQRAQRAREAQELTQLSQLHSMIQSQRSYIQSLEGKLAKQDDAMSKLADQNKALWVTYQRYRVYKKYPTWEQTVASQPFSLWLSKKPADVKDLSFSENSDDAIKLLDLYYEESRGRQKKI